MPKFCKLCGHYSFKGHRGGICERLNGLVCGQDPACSFATDWCAVKTRPAVLQLTYLYRLLRATLLPTVPILLIALR